MKPASTSFLTISGWLPSSERLYVTLIGLPSLSYPSYETLVVLGSHSHECEIFKCAELQVPGIVYCLDLIPRIEAIGLSHPLENWRARLRQGCCSKDQ